MIKISIKSKFKMILASLFWLVILQYSVLASEWNFEGTADDESGVNHGTVAGAVYVSNGYTGQALEFDGDMDYVDFGNDASLNHGTGDFSVSFWFKKRWADDVYASIFYKAARQQSNVPGYGFLLRETGGQLKFTVGDGAVITQAVGPGIGNTEWHHAVGVRGGGKVRLYLDNALVAEADDATGNTDNSENLVLAMGGYGNNPGGSYAGGFFRGLIDRVRIFDKALTASDIDQMYREDAELHREPPVIILDSPADGESDVGTAPSLHATLKDADGDDMDVSFYGSSTRAAEDEFTIIVLPDTQSYVDPGTYADIFTEQVQWIIDNKDAWNIVFVTHMGDLVNSWDDIAQWERADASMSVLDGAVPWGVLPGNHDMQNPNSFPHNAVYYNQYFGYARFGKYPWYGGHYEDTNDNNYQLFSAGGMDFIIIHLEYNLSDEALTWADGLLSAHPDRRAIVCSHYIVRYTGFFSTLGEKIFNALKHNPNLFLLLGGHDPNGSGRRTDIVGDSTIYSLMTDYQTLSEGGEGWFKMLTFSPKDNTIFVRTYSPHRNSYRTYNTERFNIDYRMTDYTLITTKTGVHNGDSITVTWPGLKDGTKYYWYVDALDTNLQTARSEARVFTTYGYASPQDDDKDSGDTPPDETELSCYNNIFNPTKGEKALIVVELPKQARVRLNLYNTRGSKIRELADEEKETGSHKYYWDGKSGNGDVVGSGLYFVHIHAGDYKKTKKIVVVK